MGEIHVGKVERYYPEAHAAIINIEKGSLRIGDQIHVAGDRENFWEEVTSMHAQHQGIRVAHTGATVSLLVTQPVHAGADVYKIDALEA